MKVKSLAVCAAIVVALAACKKEKTIDPIVGGVQDPPVYTTEIKKNDSPLSGTIFQEYRTFNNPDGYDRTITSTLVDQAGAKHIMTVYYKDSSAVNGTKLWSPYLWNTPLEVKNSTKMVVTYQEETGAGTGIFQEYRSMPGKTATIQKRAEAYDIVILITQYRMQNIAMPADSPVFDLTLRYGL